MLGIVLATLSVVSVFLSLGFGGYCFILNPRESVYRSWFYMSIAVGIWSFGHFFNLVTNSASSALIWAKIMYSVAALIPVFFVTFALRFAFWIGNAKELIKMSYLLALTLFFLTLLTPWIITDVSYNPNFGYSPRFSYAGLLVYVVHFISMGSATAVMLWLIWSSGDGFRKVYTKYLLWSWVIVFFGSTVNLLILYTTWYPIGQLFIWVYPIIVVYGIFTDRWLNIEKSQ